MKKKKSNKAAAPKIRTASAVLKASEQLSPAVIENITKAITEGIGKGLSLALKEVITSNELSTFTQNVLLNSGATGMLKALVSAEGRKGMDARFINQNALEISHILMTSLEKLKETRIDKEGELGEAEIIDAEEEYKDWLKKRGADSP